MLLLSPARLLCVAKHACNQIIVAAGVIQSVDAEQSKLNMTCVSPTKVTHDIHPQTMGDMCADGCSAEMHGSTQTSGEYDQRRRGQGRTGK